ncbi:MAG: hypothetical protein JWO80_3591 [Bryobacterales bacterium]|nr:hypothetical protein [Bryobacterales bacterium]
MIFPFIERARRRFLWNELLAQFALGAALLMAGLILLLLIGTQILDWRVILTLAAGGFAIAIYRMFRRMPSPYKVAVLVDERAGLHDSLSTALFFSAAGKAKVSDSVREAQLAQTERLLPGVNLDAAIPFTFPRALYAMGVLGLIASSLFALRYGVSRKLDLTAPLTEVVMDGLGLHSPDAKQAELHKKSGKNGERPDLLDDSNSAIPRSQQKKQGDLETAPESALDTVGDPDPNAKDGKQTASTKGGDTKAEAGEKAEGEGEETGTPSSAGKNPADNPSGSREGPQQGEQQAGSQQQSQGGSSSLLSKMKEAMSNLLSKAKQPNGPGGQKPSQGDKGGQKAQSQQKNGEKGAAGKSEKGGSQDSADSQEGQQAGDSENAEDSQGKGGGKSSDQQASSQPGSGIGKQDGSKDVRAAEQMAAMGKLSEVIGKRSQSVSGEMMIESQSGPQQLHTQYSQKSATHGESAGDVSRDEVPVALQSYVQQYFEQVRKAEHSAPASPKGKAAVTKP